MYGKVSTRGGSQLVVRQVKAGTNPSTGVSAKARLPLKRRMMVAPVEDVVVQWEPKVQSMLRGLKLKGGEYEDLAQGLRETIVRAWKKYDPSRGEASFHTYLHVAMQNCIRQTFIRIQKTFEPAEDAIVVEPAYNDECEMFWDAFRVGNPTPKEMLVLDILLCGYKPSQVALMCTGDVMGIMKSLRRKFIFLKQGELLA